MIAEISLAGLAIAFIPALVVIAIMVFWHSIAATALYATARMLVQLLLIGYVLVYIFESDNWLVILGVLTIMLFASGWIATRTLDSRSTHSFLQALGSIAIGGLLTLALVTQFVLQVEPWFSPRHVIPLAGMILASAMNAVSLAAERFQAERARDVSYLEARRTALQAALIPIINSLFAVGLVSLPGMMTGQILAGVSPLIAVRYQILIMCMIFGASGLASACYLSLRQPRAEP